MAYSSVPRVYLYPLRAGEREREREGVRERSPPVGERDREGAGERERDRTGERLFAR